MMDRSWMPTAAGILNIIAGVLALLGALVVIFVATVIMAVPEMTEGSGDDLPLAVVSGLLWGFVALSLLSGMLSMIGGVVALRRTGWAWPLAGAISALFSAMPVGIFALILVVLAEKDLRGGYPPPLSATAGS
jgi:hypothetical protein